MPSRSILRYYTLDVTTSRCTLSNRHTRNCSTANAKNSFGVSKRPSLFLELKGSKSGSLQLGLKGTGSDPPLQIKPFILLRF